MANAYEQDIFKDCNTKSVDIVGIIKLIHFRDVTIAAMHHIEEFATYSEGINAIDARVLYNMLKETKFLN